MGDLIKLIISFVIFLIVIVVGIIMFSTPLGYECYQRQCIKYTIDQFSSCKHLGLESTGFLSSEDFYLCDGIKIAKKCSEYSNIKIELEITIVDILMSKCQEISEAKK